MARRATKTTPAAVAYNDLVLCGQKMDVAYSVPAIQPAADGQWRVEPDKIAWTDPTTGYPCIIRRERGGHLGAYVGLHRQHPLYGYEADAIPPMSSPSRSITPNPAITMARRAGPSATSVAVLGMTTCGGSGPSAAV